MAYSAHCRQMYLDTKHVECMPYIMQAFIKKPEDVEKGLDFDRKLYIVRRRV